MTETTKRIMEITTGEEKLDHQVKVVLALRPVLASILKETVTELKGMTRKEVEACIVGEPSIERIPIEPGFTNNEEIMTLSEEDYIPGEGFDRFDIRVDLLIPGKDEAQRIKLLIDVEAQKDEHPPYDVATRGIFYCCRLISSQLGREFSNSRGSGRQYADIKKVYSIWICTETAKKRSGSIERYRITKDVLCGINSDKPYYDLMEVIKVNLSAEDDFQYADDSTGQMMSMLSGILDRNLTKKEKLDVLEDYGIDVGYDDVRIA